MSNSTLTDYYRGMKMPNYDGKNVFQQIQSLNGASPGFQEIVDMPAGILQNQQSSAYAQKVMTQ